MYSRFDATNHLNQLWYQREWPWIIIEFWWLLLEEQKRFELRSGHLCTISLFREWTSVPNILRSEMCSMAQPAQLYGLAHFVICLLHLCINSISSLQEIPLSNVLNVYERWMNVFTNILIHLWNTLDVVDVLANPYVEIVLGDVYGYVSTLNLISI